MKAGIDRVEGTLAVLIPIDDESKKLTIPIHLLPPGCREGDILSIGIEKDKKATGAERERVKNLIEKLKKRK
jgi:hypothetical protein